MFVAKPMLVPSVYSLLILLTGHRVCKESWAHLLGVGKNRLRRCRHSFQGKDLRSVSGRGGYSSKL